MGVKLGNGKWAIKEDKLLAYNDNSGRFFNKEFDFSRGSSATYVAKDGLIKTAGLQATNLVNNGDFSELGSELVTNGNFDTDSDWTKGVGWTISGGKAIKTGTVASNFDQLNTGVFTNNKTYKITFNISNSNDGRLLIYIGGNSVTIDIANATNGTHTFYGKADGEDYLIFRNDTSGFQGSIDNVSVKQVDPNDYWEVSSQSELTSEGARIYSSDGSFQYIQQQGVFETNKTYKLELDIISSNGATLGFYGGIPDISNTSTLGKRILYVSPTTTYLQIKRSSGVTDITISNISVQEVQTDTPRIDFSDSVKGALLLEPQSTNLVTYSEDFSSWNKDASVSITSTNNTSPTNESNASKITVTDSGRLYHDPSISTTADRVTSIFLKGGSFVNFKLTCIVTSEIDLSTETASNGFGIEKLSNGWFRISTTPQSVTPTSRRIQIQAYPDNTYTNGHEETGTYYLFGVQMENSILTSYIPTNGSTVTRLADVCNNSGSAQDFNSEEGVLYAEIAALANDGTSRNIALSKDTNDRIQMYFNTSDNSISVFYKSQGTHSFIMNETLTDATEFNKIAFKWKTNDFALWVNGTETDTVSSGVTSNADTLNALEFEMFNDSGAFYGKVREVQVFTEALTDEQLQKLTTI